MVETAAHLTDYVFPKLPVRQSVLSVPKRLRYFMQRDGALLNMALGIFLWVIAQNLQTHSPGAANAPKATLHIGAVAFIHLFGSCLNEHVHFKLRGSWRAETAGLPGSSRSPPVPKLWKQLAKRGCKFSPLSGSLAA